MRYPEYTCPLRFSIEEDVVKGGFTSLAKSLQAGTVKPVEALSVFTDIMIDVLEDGYRRGKLDAREMMLQGMGLKTRHEHVVVR